MKVFVVLAALCALACGSQLRFPSPRLVGRIVGGEDANIEDLPYQLVLLSDDTFTCGASIISANVALTAAHCVVGESASSISLRAGSSCPESGGSVHQAKKITVHHNYGSHDFDIAIIEVSTPFPLGSAGVQAIELADSEPAGDASATVSGWGTLSLGGSLPTQLQRAEVAIVARNDCQKKNDITDRMICAAAPGKDHCHGDSGGPLASGGRLVGIVAWGIGCADPDYPGVYTNVASLRDWVRQNSGV